MRISDWSSDVCSSDLERHPSPALVRLSHLLERRFGIAVAEAHEMLLAVAPDGELEPFRECVDDADPDAMKAPRHLVRILVRRVVELSAGVALADRTRVVQGKSASVRVALGGRR